MPRSLAFLAAPPSRRTAKTRTMATSALKFYSVLRTQQSTRCIPCQGSCPRGQGWCILCGCCKISSHTCGSGDGGSSERTKRYIHGACTWMPDDPAATAVSRIRAALLQCPVRHTTPHRTGRSRLRTSAKTPLPWLTREALTVDRLSSKIRRKKRVNAQPLYFLIII